jgi:hypothetical membrane protein
MINKKRITQKKLGKEFSNARSPHTIQNDPLTRLMAICGILGPIQFIVVILIFGLLRPGYDPVRQYMSELGAVGAPNAIAFILPEFLLGLTMIAFAFGLYRGISKGKGTKLALILIVVSGVGWLGASIFRCDAGCVNESVTGTMHGIFGIFAVPPLLITPLVIVPRLKKDNQWLSYRPFSLIMGALGIPLFCVMFSAEVSPALESYRGLLQRLTFFTPLLWTVVMAIRLLCLCEPFKKKKVTDMPISP